MVNRLWRLWTWLTYEIEWWFYIHCMLCKILTLNINWNIIISIIYLLLCLFLINWQLLGWSTWPLLRWHMRWVHVWAYWFLLTRSHALSWNYLLFTIIGIICAFLLLICKFINNWVTHFHLAFAITIIF